MTKPTQTKKATACQKTPQVIWSDEHCNNFGQKPQAQHSPLPKRIAIGKVDGELVDENGFYISAEATKHEIVRRYNNADALAEACQMFLTALNKDQLNHAYAFTQKVMANWEAK